MASSSQRGDSERLSRIETHWSLVRRAHDADSPRIVDAKQQLLLQYASAIRRYTGAVMRDDEAADEVFQDFSLKFIRGDFHAASPELGRFRQFVKTSLFRLIADYYRKQSKHRTKTLAAEPADDRTSADAVSQAEEMLLLEWREELLNRTWNSLDEYSRRNHAAFYTALRLRVENPQWSSDELAEQLRIVLDKPMNAGGARTLLHRARQRFAQLLLDNLADSLDSDSFEALESEVVELRLADYCREALDARRG